jgi:hypothetical protein
MFKKHLVLLFAILLPLFSLITTGCSDITGPQKEENNNQELLKSDYLYFWSSGDNDGLSAAFFVNASAPTQIKSDLCLASSIIGYSFPNTNDHDIVQFKVIFGDTMLCTARRSDFKWSEIPVHGTYSFDGIGVVMAKNLAFRYKETSGNIEVFNISTGVTNVLPAQHINNAVNIQGGIQLLPNPTCFDPNQSNSHRWDDGSFTGGYNAYRLWWH